MCYCFYATARTRGPVYQTIYLTHEANNINTLTNQWVTDFVDSRRKEAVIAKIITLYNRDKQNRISEHQTLKLKPHVP